MTKQSISQEQNGTRRVIDTPMDGKFPARTFTKRDDVEVRVYEYAEDDDEGRRVYRHMSTERV